MAHEQFQGLQQGDARFQEGQQLLIEQHQGFRLQLGPAPEGRIGAGDLKGKSPFGEDSGSEGFRVIRLELAHQHFAVGMGESD